MMMALTAAGDHHLFAHLKMPLDQYLELLGRRILMPDNSIIIRTGSVHTCLSLGEAGLLVRKPSGLSLLVPLFRLSDRL